MILNALSTMSFWNEQTYEHTHFLCDLNQFFTDSVCWRLAYLIEGRRLFSRFSFTGVDMVLIVED